MPMKMHTVTKLLLAIAISGVTACNCACGADDRGSAEDGSGIYPTWTDTGSDEGVTGSGSGIGETGETGESTGGDTTGDGDGDGDGDGSCVSFCDPLCPENVAVRYLVRDASEDPGVAQYSGGHGLHIPHFFCDDGTAIFTVDPPVAESELVVRDTWDAWLGGTATVATDGCDGVHDAEVWDLNMELVKPGMPVSPKRELKDPDVNQPPDITNGWQYWLISDQIVSTLTDQTSPATAVLTRKPTDGTYGFQLGYTANGKNLNFGAAVWFYYDHTTDAGLSRLGAGDVNLTVREVCSNVM